MGAEDDRRMIITPVRRSTGLARTRLIHWWLQQKRKQAEWARKIMGGQREVSEDLSCLGCFL